MDDEPGLRPSEPVGQTLRAVARHILAEARAAIEDRDRIEAVAVHDFRAAMKSWRAYLRLIEPFLEADDLELRTEARDLARALAGARDAQAALDAISDAEAHTVSHRFSLQSWQTIRHKLDVLRAAAESASLTPAVRKRIGAALERADARVERWPLDPVTFPDVAESLHKGYRRARRAIPEDWRMATSQDLHELRTRVVVHRYQMEIIEPLWPRLGRSWVKEAQRLRTRLGRHNDLTVLAHYTEPHGPLARWRSRLQSAISQRQTQHVAAARRIAARLFAEKPKAFQKRLEAMWNGASAANGRQ
jgi:CHAD domain-containing protein